MKNSRFLLLFIALIIVGCGGGSVKSGNSVSGSFTETVQLKTYTFDVQAGDAIHLSADSTHQTHLSVYDDSDVLVGAGFNGFYRNGVLTTGTYRVDVVPRYSGTIDNFTLHYANGSTANENGELVSGEMVSESITSNDLDSFILLAMAGDSIHLSVDSTNQTLLHVYNPDGSLQGSSFNSVYRNSLPQTGMYRVVVQARYAFTTDEYNIHYINGSTANEHGELLSGGMVSGSITSNDLDSFILDAVAGDSIYLSVDSTNQTLLHVYNPDGSLQGSSFNGYYRNSLPQTGEYRVVVQSRYAFTTDEYNVHYANGSTANELGFIDSGSTVSESFTSNDLDSYQFNVIAGEDFTLSTSGDTQTYLSVYAQNGMLLGHGFNGFSAQNIVTGGIYRVIVQSRYAFVVGDYEISLN